MRCGNIVLISFEVKDQNLELIENVQALEKKYSSRMENGRHVNVTSVHIHPGEENMVLEKFSDAASLDKLERLKEEDNNGLYLIIHAGATQSRPEASVLAEQTAALIKAGVRFRKINLAGCFSGGKKLGNVAQSALKQYTDRLKTLFNTSRETLGSPWVCAYLAEVTTFDEDSNYMRGLLKVRGQVASDPLEGLTGVHNLVKEGHNIRPTHLPVQLGQVKQLTDAIATVREAAVNSTAVRKKRQTLDEQQESEIDQTKLEECIQAQFGVQRKKLEKQNNTINIFQQVINNYERYMREKIVVRYDPVTGSFKPASLAEYTDNATASLLMTQVPHVVGAKRFAFNL
jgi:hypothetical protein